MEVDAQIVVLPAGNLRCAMATPPSVFRLLSRPVAFFLFISVTVGAGRLYSTSLGRPYRLAVRTSPFHGGGTGSIPVRVAIPGIWGGVVADLAPLQCEVRERGMVRKVSDKEMHWRPLRRFPDQPDRWFFKDHV